ncbi:dTDP-glucose 4,6-dehydratase [Chloroflexota bacterium]
MKILVTGGAGFIGTNFIHYILQTHVDWELTNLDKVTYAGNLENLQSIEEHPRYNFQKGDIADREVVDKLLGQKFDVIVNLAAESHVDRSIQDAAPFIDTNIRGTQVLLEAVRRNGCGKFIQVSTDEVYGSIENGSFTENSPLNPSSPYSASKASADLLCLAYYRTHQIPVVITRCTNNYGPYQFPEKLIPLVITNALEDKWIPVYGDGLNARDWIHVLDHCRALDTVVKSGNSGEIYNIAGNNEKTNLGVVQAILRYLKKPESLICFVSDRPGHDRRYAIDNTKIEQDLGWKPASVFNDTLASTIEWYMNNKPWWSRVKSGDYIQYYEKMYHNR